MKRPLTMHTFKFAVNKSCLVAMVLTVMMAVAACSPQNPETESDVTLFINGDILTMNNALPSAEG